MLRHYFSLLSLVLAIFFFTACTQEQTGPRPNVIFILADDLGAGDLHISGHPYVKSPNLDKFAQEGMRFSKAYMAASWCAPSRYALMSGQYPAKSFFKNGNLIPEEESVLRLMKTAGYAIGHFGKWHMNIGEEYAQSPEDFGVDQYFVPKGWPKTKSWRKEEQNDAYLRAKSTDRFVDLTINFIEENANSPFYVNLWVYPTHAYIHPTPEQLSPYANLEADINDFNLHQRSFLQHISDSVDLTNAMKAYCADVTAMDAALGRLFDYLSSVGLDSNTIIIFASDNGPGPIVTDLNSGKIYNRYQEQPDLKNSVGSAGQFAERKQSLREGGIRVPYVVRWPGFVPANSVDSVTQIHGIDLLPTLASLISADIALEKVDGQDMSQAFLGEPINSRDALYWLEDGRAAIRDGEYKGYLSTSQQFSYYNIEDDPMELNPLEKPNKELLQKLKTWLKSIE